ncbi:MAG: 2-oxo acid dehydrogenase subunit E2 [Nocardioidaceae bacterium]|nr:2-oxo acid dehydrogenase subunit E2 [Nocardioidaceae bacterium]MCO5323977.1 2-oxo acid dehydrogenase subunit E2 [Nocardioidaceae bacterium]
MSAEYLLPDVGEGLTEAELVTWRVELGQVIAVNDVVCEIETAKSIVELPSPYAGKVEALLVAEGQTIEVGTPLIRIDDGTGSESAPQTEGQPTLVGYGPKEVTAQRRARRAAAPNDPAAAAAQMQIQGHLVPDEAPSKDIGLHAVEAHTQTPSRQPRQVDVGQHKAGSGGVLASPAVRALARERSIDLTAITGTGPQGSITIADLTQAGGGHPRETREPIKGLRKAMADAMVASAFSAPHVTEWITVDVTRSMELVETVKQHPELSGAKVTPLVLLARACVLALRRTPVINSTWDDAAKEIVTKSYVHLGIAAATPRGLVVPNIKDANQLDLTQLSTALDSLVETARAGGTQPADMAGGTFTITNVGVFGVDAGTPIINPGESAILCFGAINRRPWVVGAGANERVEPRDVATFALAFDHRHIDGAAASAFLADVALYMQDPAVALLS